MVPIQNVIGEPQLIHPVASVQMLALHILFPSHCNKVLSNARAGSASRGLYRVHQFSKVEMFVLCTPAQSEALLDELCGIEEEIFGELGLHFRILVRLHLVASGNKRAPAAPGEDRTRDTRLIRPML